MPPLPVVTRYGFYYFSHSTGRFSSATKVNGKLVYARDYREFVGQQVECGIAEPDDSDFAIAMNW